MKLKFKFIVVLIIIIATGKAIRAQTQEIPAIISPVPLTLNSIELENDQYPVLFYNDVIYVIDGFAPALSIDISESENEVYIAPVDLSEIETYEFDVNNNTCSYEAKVLYPSTRGYNISFFKNPNYFERAGNVGFKVLEKKIFLNGNEYVNDEYPFLQSFSDDTRVEAYTFIPLTQEVASAFGWRLYYTPENGLSVYADGHFECFPKIDGSYYITMAVSDYYVFGDTVISMGGARQARNFGLIIKTYGHERNVVIDNETREGKYWSLGADIELHTGPKPYVSQFYVMPRWSYNNGILTINAVHDRREEDDYKFIFADITVDCASGKILSVSNEIVIPKNMTEKFVNELMQQISSEHRGRCV